MARNIQVVRTFVQAQHVGQLYTVSVPDDLDVERWADADVSAFDEHVRDFGILLGEDSIDVDDEDRLELTIIEPRA